MMPQPPWVHHGHTLTGQFRYRKGWRGRLILQVEEAYFAKPPFHFDWIGQRRTTWRDAQSADAIRIHGLMVETQWVPTR